MKNNRNLLQKLFNYVRPLWEVGGKISIHRTLAIAFSLDFITLGANAEGFALVEAGLIAALLALKSYFTLEHTKKNSTQSPQNINENGNSNQILD